MTVSRLAHIPGIGVNVMGDRADAAADPTMLRMENLDTDLRPPAVALEHTRRAVEDDEANSYLPFEGHLDLRTAAAGLVSRLSGREYDPARECVSVAGGLNGILNALLAITEPGDEVVLSDPIYAGLVNRVRLAGAVPVHVPAVPTPQGWRTDPDELAAAVGPRTAAVLLMGPSMPTGAVFDRSHLDALAGPVARARRVDPLRRGDGAHPLRRPPARAPRVAPRPGRTRHHRRLGVQGAADDRVEGRVGRRARRHPRRHRPGGHDQRRLPGRARPGRGRRRPHRARRGAPTSPQPRAPGATAARSSSSSSPTTRSSRRTAAGRCWSTRPSSVSPPPRPRSGSSSGAGSPPPRWAAGDLQGTGTCAWCSPTSPSSDSTTCASGSRRRSDDGRRLREKSGSRRPGHLPCESETSDGGMLWVARWRRSSC